MARVNGSPTTSDCLSYQWAHIRDAEGPIKKKDTQGVPDYTCDDAGTG